MSLASVQKQDDSSVVRVMVVDDSAVIRGLITRWLDADPAIKVTATAHNGAMALRNLAAAQPDVVILDIEMPEMDGLTALPKIMAADPHIKVIMASTLTRRNAEISLCALQAGAADYIPKPETSREVSTSDEFRQILIEKVKTLGKVARIEGARPARKLRSPEVAVVKTKVNLPPKPIQLVKPSSVQPRILAVGSSTGGPQALFEFLGALKPAPLVPVVITQHMPKTFTSILADHLRRASGFDCQEGQDGERLVSGKVYIAPGDYHMTVEASGSDHVIRINQNPPENFCRPSVDPMLRSVVKCFGPATLAVILTGMGSDGLSGGREVVAGGGTVLAQDEATSVVWGMPGAIANAGLASAVLPLNEIGKIAAKFISGGRR